MKIKAKEKTLGDLDFQKTKDDNKLALSIEDEKFLKIMDEHMYKDEANSCVPFKHPRPHLPYNKEQALSRLSSLRRTLENKPKIKAFPKEDHAKEIKDLDLNGERPHTQRSLGLTWDIVTDTFNFQVSDNDKPNTRRGVLSTVNSLYDPLGFAAPVITHGRLLLRELSVDSIEWDSPLPEDKRG